MDNKIDFELLKKFTNDFLDLHWKVPNGIKEDKYPKWDEEPWKFKGSIKGLSVGVYAFFDEEENVVYIGSGTSGQGQYQGYGVCTRLNAYIKVKPGNRKGTEETEYEFKDIYLDLKQKGIKCIRILLLTNGMGYLAYSLEAYLIMRIVKYFGLGKLLNKNIVSDYGGYPDS